MTAGDIIVVNENSFARKGNIFDGVDDYVLHDAHAIARVAANDQTGTYTAWIYANSQAASQRTILSAGDNSSVNEFLQFYIHTGQLFIKLVHGGATQFLVHATTEKIPARKWTHVTIVQNGVSPVLYINGKIVNLTVDTPTDLTFWYDELTLVDKFAIGVLESNNTHTADFTGAIGQVKYFNIALTDNEILVEAQGGTHSGDRGDDIESARVFDITMEDDGVTDSGSGADDGTLVGNAHYGGEISTYSLAMERNLTGHAAEVINSFPIADRILSIIKRGD